MDRRKFLKNSSLLLASTAFTKLNFNNIFQEEKNFSLEIITDNPDYTIKIIEELIKEKSFGFSKFKFSEYQLNNSVVGDIVLIQDKKLINYKNSNDELSKNLREISKQLNLPKTIENPTSIKFFTENNNDAKEFLIFHKNILVKKINSNATLVSHEIQGTKGKITLNITNGHVKVVKSSCEHKTCIKMNSIYKSAQYIVCIPNEIQIIAE